MVRPSSGMKSLLSRRLLVRCMSRRWIEFGWTDVSHGELPLVAMLRPHIHDKEIFAHGFLGLPVIHAHDGRVVVKQVDRHSADLKIGYYAIRELVCEPLIPRLRSVRGGRATCFKIFRYKIVESSFVFFLDGRHQLTFHVVEDCDRACAGYDVACGCGTSSRGRGVLRANAGGEGEAQQNDCECLHNDGTQIVSDAICNSKLTESSGDRG